MKYHNHKIMMFICATAFSVTACSSSNSFSDPIDFETPSEVPNPIPTQGTAKTFTTTADGTYSLAEGETKLFDGVSMAPTTIEIDKNKKIPDYRRFRICHHLLFLLQSHEDES